MPSFGGKIKEPFYLENASNLSLEFYYNFNIKIQNFFKNYLLKTLYVKFDAFSRQMAHLFNQNVLSSVYNKALYRCGSSVIIVVVIKNVRVILFLKILIWNLVHLWIMAF